MRLTPFETLSQSEIIAVHAASLDILENCGVLVHSATVLRMLEDNGCEVDYAKKSARIPKKLVESCISMAPHTFTLYDRMGRAACVVGDAEPKCASGHNAIFVMDTQSNERRYATVRDVEAFALLSDQLENIDIVGVPLNPQDVSSKATLLYAVKALFENTTKPLFFSTESREVNVAIIDMMKAVAGTDDIAKCPNAICQLSPTSPLYWEKGAVEGIVDAAQNGVPLNILPEPMSGVSAPYSVAGLLTVHNTEVLSGIVIAQIVRPGTPVIYGSSWTTYDMKSTAAVIASPETHILRVAGCQMARYYNVPSHTTALNSDANGHDEQNAWEKALSNICAICADNDVVMNAGMFASGLTISLEQLVLDDEMNGMIRRMRKGVDVSEGSIAAEVIKNVGPARDYLLEDHTLDNLRSGEFWESRTKFCQNYEQWISQGAPGAEMLAKRRAEALQNNGKTNPLDEDTSKLLYNIIKRFEKEYC
jgi:trimethylamine--corrinoid protein Co-methyltransferase